MKNIHQRIVVCVLAITGVAFMFAGSICFAVSAGCCDYEVPNELCMGDGYDCDGCTILGDCGDGKLVKHGGVNVCVGGAPYECTRSETKTACYTYYECDATSVLPILQCIWLNGWHCYGGFNIWCPTCGGVGSGLTEKAYDYSCG